MKLWGMILCIGLALLLIFLCITPSKKLKCQDDMCMILEKTMLNPKPRIQTYFFKSDIVSVSVETEKGTDFLVLKTRSAGDIHLKFIHTQSTRFQKRKALNARMNKFFQDLAKSRKPYETEWQREVGSVQIYMYGQPLFK